MQPEQETRQDPFLSPYHKLGANLYFTASWFTRIKAEWLTPYGLSPQQFNLLRILRGQHPRPSTATLLKERMLDRTSNVSRLVEKLRRKGLVERRTCRADRRAVDVVITEKGLRLLKQIDEQGETWATPFETLSLEEADELNRLLDKLRG